MYFGHYTLDQIDKSPDIEPRFFWSEECTTAQ